MTIQQVYQVIVIAVMAYAGFCAVLLIAWICFETWDRLERWFRRKERANGTVFQCHSE